MKKLFITSVILISSFCFSQNSEWTYIFDGKSFNGWHQYNGESVGSQWSISNGELIFTNNRDSKQDIVTDNEYSNFEPSMAPCSGLLIQHSHSITAQTSHPYCVSFENMVLKSIN